MRISLHPPPPSPIAGDEGFLVSELIPREKAGLAVYLGCVITAHKWEGDRVSVYKVLASPFKKQIEPEPEAFSKEVSPKQFSDKLKEFKVWDAAESKRTKTSFLGDRGPSLQARPNAEKNKGNSLKDRL